MPSFGYATVSDALSWAAVMLLGAKLVATIVLLAQGRKRAPLVRPSQRRLYWIAKLTPLVAVPLLIALATLQADWTALWVWAVMMAFVLVAVPLTVRARARAGLL